MEGVSIVLLSHNNRALLKKSLGHIYRHSGTFTEVVLVDNGSQDGTVAMVEEEFPEVEIVPLKENVGVSAGRNIGAANAGGDLLFFYDDDGCFDFPSLPPVIELMEQKDDIAVAGLRVINLREEDIFGLDMARYRVNGCEPRVVRGFKGGAAIIKRDVFLKVGGYPEHFFYCCEESDLSYRLFRRGYRIVHCEGATMLHMKPLGRGARRRRFYYHYRNRLFEMWRNLPLLEALKGTLVLSGTGLIGGLLTGEVVPYARGLATGFIGLPRVLVRERDPMTWSEYQEYLRMFHRDVSMRARINGFIDFIRLWRHENGERWGGK